MTLVERLRDWQKRSEGTWAFQEIGQAVERIEILEAALQEIIDDMDSKWTDPEIAKRIARKALNPSEPTVLPQKPVPRPAS